MATAKLYNLAKMTVSGTPGTGTITLGSAVTGWLTFANAGVQNGDVVTYAINDGSNSEVGRGTYNSAGPTITRGAVSSTNGGAAISATSSAIVGITAIAQDFDINDYTAETDFTIADLLEIYDASVAAKRKGILPNVAPITSGMGWSILNGSLAVSASGSALTIALKTAAGTDPSASDPVWVRFRSATATTSTYVDRRITGALSIVVSNGSTLGVTSSTAFRLWVVIFDDAGTIRLGVINCVDSNFNIYPVADDDLASSTAEGGAGAADSAGVIYTGTAVTAKAMRVVGYVEWSASGLTAGTWTTTNLLKVQMWSIGMKLPGDVVASRYMTTTATFQSTSSTYQTNTALTISYAPKSAANLIRCQSTGTIQVGSTSSAGRVQFHYDSFPFGSWTSQAQIAGGYSPCTAQGVTRPNSLTTMNFNPKVASTDNSTAVQYPQNFTAVTRAAMELHEIMA